MRSNLNIYTVCATKLEEGKSKLDPFSHRGRTQRERAKNARRLARRQARADEQEEIRRKAGAGKK